MRLVRKATISHYQLPVSHPTNYLGLQPIKRRQASHQAAGYMITPYYAFNFQYLQFRTTIKQIFVQYQHINVIPFEHRHFDTTHQIPSSILQTRVYTSYKITIIFPDIFEFSRKYILFLWRWQRQKACYLYEIVSQQLNMIDKPQKGVWCRLSLPHFTVHSTHQNAAALLKLSTNFHGTHYTSR